MKKIMLVAACAAFYFSCQEKKQEETTVAETTNESNYASFGATINEEGALSSEEMMQKFNGLKEGDTIDVKFKSTIHNVCQKKGCWMTLDLADDKETFVKFKDYGFFVPMNATDKEVIVNGKAFVSVESVEDLQHYAKDAGKSQEAIDSITEPKVTYSFMADGVLIAK
ncbi:DUF4920 domain-containing protein [Flavobacterium sp. NRK F7]|uniref:DUF4920 domain-containing protein n=1 Tax=Flavobacterium sp. NRK F7 TaxID=2954930 RepID=UPI002091D71C|nr:DUF4920 domain-containing protein [Flavobacterium sp. NRK F7]MCO6163032.1 DUF4920 domain-containing protein [Flavobacterium sp. NRK F7]